MTSVVYLVRGAALALVWLVAVNVVTTALVTAAGRWAAGDRPRSAGFWLAMRLFPAAASVGFVGMFFVPSYWRYEPRGLGEPFDLTLTACAALGMALLALGGARGGAAWTAAARRTRAWRQISRPLTLEGVNIPVYAIELDAPIMALAGVLRPRLLITRGVIDALTPEELHAGIAHEVGHWHAWDNLKRLAMRAAPDLLFCTPAAASIERRWASAAEYAADRDGCGDALTRCALASALVKVARLTPPRTPLAEPISTLVDGGEIASRVERLLSDSVDTRTGRRTLPLAVAASLIALTYAPALELVHEVTELLVHSLP